MEEPRHYADLIMADALVRQSEQQSDVDEDADVDGDGDGIGEDEEEQGVNSTISSLLQSTAGSHTVRVHGADGLMVKGIAVAVIIALVVMSVIWAVMEILVGVVVWAVLSVIGCATAPMPLLAEAGGFWKCTGKVFAWPFKKVAKAGKAIYNFFSSKKVSLLEVSGNRAGALLHVRDNLKGGNETLR
eukprot:gnl/TRDRNA2_/TRDRNA2_175896_c3_seq1.p1 gnl/TRDRNA2_/TRDRNA2_175896_c3~~gnl/TRDRNA2_/TRDRNA2_175896_c3_seq1.p1  ORF type:complete len:187 (-),score=30.03 gnl/TRDRNA2_/TRDRNA2_175896_c3_seq1:87-647(-)